MVGEGLVYQVSMVPCNRFGQRWVRITTGLHPERLFGMRIQIFSVPCTKWGYFPAIHLGSGYSSLFVMPYCNRTSFFQYLASWQSQFLRPLPALRSNSGLENFSLCIAFSWIYFVLLFTVFLVTIAITKYKQCKPWIIAIRNCETAAEKDAFDVLQRFVSVYMWTGYNKRKKIWFLSSNLSLKISYSMGPFSLTS